MEKSINIGNVIAEIEKIDLGQLQAELDPIEIGELEVDIERNENLYKKATVKNGTVKKYGSEIEVKDGTILIKKGDRVSYKADVPEGKYFDYWVYPDGEIYSSINNFDIVLNDLYGNYDLTAVFSDNPVQRSPKVRFIEYDSLYKYIHQTGSRRYDFYISTDIPNDYTLNEWGIIYSSKIQNDEDMDFNHNVGKFINNDPSTQTNNSVQNMYLVMSQIWFEEERKAKIRVYAIIEQNGEEQTIYSDEVITIQLHLDMS